MAKNTYQSYTPETPISTFRADFMRRGAMCAALANRHPDLAAVGAEARTLAAAIDSRLGALQQSEDDQLIANALEDAAKVEVIEVYTELRRTMHAKNYEVLAILPDAPSSLGRLGVDNFKQRTEVAIANIKALPETDRIRVEFLPNLERELAEFRTADASEDQTRAQGKTLRLGLTLYKSELAQCREAQLGTILSILKDREKVALFTLPWRKSSRDTEDSSPTP